MILILLQRFISLLHIRIETRELQTKFNKARQREAEKITGHGLFASSPISALDSSIVLFKIINNLACQQIGIFFCFKPGKKPKKVNPRAD